MKHILVLQDVVAGHFMQPFFSPSIGSATRNLQDEIKRGGEDNVLAKHPEDFRLFTIGFFDEATGEIVVTKPEFQLEIRSLAEGSK